MRILADENIPRTMVEALRSVGHDVTAVASEAPGSTDNDVVALAIREGRLLVTGDKDFGEMVFRSGARISAGVVLTRVHGTPDERTFVLLAALASRPADEWAGHFAVIEDGRIRLTPLPAEEPGAG